MRRLRAGAGVPSSSRVPPCLPYPVYAVCPAQSNDELIGLALNDLRSIASRHQVIAGSWRRADASMICTCSASVAPSN